MQKSNSVIIVIFIFVLFLPSYISIFYNLNLKETENSSNLKISPVDSINLEYGEYWRVSLYTCKWYEDVRWEFINSNQNVSIRVLIMTFKNFEKFLVNYSDYSYYNLSCGNKQIDSGIFNIPFTNYWDLVFVNLDPIKQSTSIEYKWQVQLNLGIFIIIPFILNLTLIGFSVFLVLMRKKIKLGIEIFGGVVAYISILLFYFSYFQNYFVKFITW